jgi:NAD(P)-dependent dehydrogenase (short-subunit alcohol dehydrogenase family)
MFVERLRLDGRCVIVAGAGGGGIGTRSVQAMLEAGATVIGVDRDEAALAAVTTEFEGQPFVGVNGDVTTDEGIASIISAAQRECGRIDGLVNVIGGTMIDGWAPTLDYTREQWRTVMTINVDYVMFLGQAVAKVMIDGGGGSIVNVASTAGLAAAPYHVAYGTSKAGVVALTRTMAVEWGQYGIRANVIAPGTINTPRAKPLPPDRRDRVAIPLHRRGEPREIASVALFLISDLSSYVNGQLIPVDGGMSWKWAHLGVDNEPIFVNNDEMRAKMGLGPLDRGAG